MFIDNGKNKPKRWYASDGQQRAAGRFLCLFSDDNHNLWGVVRRCSMQQCGHFMMGSIRVGTQTLTMSGTYGSDGLPEDIEKVHEENKKYLTPVREELKKIFWKGGGWNSAGAEAMDMHNWGKQIDTKK